MAKPLRNDISIQGLENLTPGEGVQIDKDTKYEYASELSTDGVPLIDPGIGRTIAIRVFTYRINPGKKLPDDKQLIFNNHAKEIERFLWGDGLVPFEDAAPRVIIDKKKGFYQIFVPSKARQGVMFMEKPKNLSEVLQKNGKLDPKNK